MRWTKVTWFQPILVVVFVAMWVPLVTWLSLPRFEILPRPNIPAVDLITAHVALIAMLAMVYVGWRRGITGHPDRWQTAGFPG